MVNDAHHFPPVDLAPPDAGDGFWWCRKCHRISEPVDPGDPWPQCAHCKRRQTLLWKAPSPEQTLRPPVPVPPGDHAHTLFSQILDVVDGKDAA